MPGSASGEIRQNTAGLGQHKEETECIGYEVPRSGSLVSDTLCPVGVSKTTRTSQERHGADSSRSPAPAYRARLLLIASSKVADINIYDGCGEKDDASSQNAVAQNASTDLYLGTAVYGEDRVGWTSFLRYGSLVFGTSCPRAG